MTSTEQFLKNHKLRTSDNFIQQIVDDFHAEMANGLQGKQGSLRMIPTYIEADNAFAQDLPVLAIDAGGTNFRVAIATFRQGKLEITGTRNFSMPGIDREVSKKEFFNIIAGYLSGYAEKAARIGFCFSYATEILPSKDGRLLQFSKEVQAPEVVGELIGANLLDTLGMPGKPIVLLNDTVATLLAGKSESFGKSYDSFIGYILGTGTNTCYIESNANIAKTPGLDASKSQIINIESGNFGKAPRTDIDLAFDNTTSNPGQYTFEKMFAGGYFGGFCLMTLKTAAREGVFSKETAHKILAIQDLSTELLNNYRHGTTWENPLKTAISDKQDVENARVIIDALIARAARLVAANIAAVILKSGKGKSADAPILMTSEGTTFYKLYSLREQFEKYLSDYLSSDRKRYYEFTEVAQSSLVGGALAALID